VSDPVTEKRYADWVNRHAGGGGRTALDEVVSIRAAMQKLEAKQNEIEKREARAPGSGRRAERTIERLDAEYQQLTARLDAFPSDVLDKVEEALGSNDDVALFNNR
jgi:phage shock protein A